MAGFRYDDFAHPIRGDLVQTHRAAWARLALPGAWWTGEQRVAAAAEVRLARSQRSDPPWLREVAPEVEGSLPAAVLDVVRRVAIDAHRLERGWCEERVRDLGDAAYAELVAVVACVTMVDTFAESVGAALEPLPDPMPGEPTRVRPDGLADMGAWIDLKKDFPGPNVGRALSLAPDDNLAFMGLVGGMYAIAEFFEMVWERPLSRPQVELVASRVAAVNECFY